MIPYDDLVAALSSWRARQGLPVTATPTAGSGPTAVPNTGSGAYAMPGSGGVAQHGSGPRTAPPAPPKHGGYQPPPLASPDTADDSLDVDDAALLEESHYDNEGADFGMSFDANVERNDDESTSLGYAPERESFGGATELDPNAGSGKTRKPW